MCSLEIENVSHISITLKTSDMADHKRRSGDSYGTFLLKSPGLSEEGKKVTLKKMSSRLDCPRRGPGG